MSEVSNAVAIYGLQASLATEQTNASGIVPVGPSQTQRTFLDADVAYAFRANLPNIGDEAVVDLTDASGDVTAAIPSPAGGLPTIISITGTLTTDGTTPLTVPLLYYTEMEASKPKYEAENDSFAFALYWDSGEGKWIFELTIKPSLENEFWYSSVADTASPDLASGWLPDEGGSNTGTPVVAVSPYTLPSLIDADGKDIYGQPIPTVAEINGLLIECVSGAATITGADGFEYSPTANAVLQISNTSTGVITPDDLTIEATAANTAVKVTVIGQAV
jgi:hypothetical protein